MRSVRTTRDPLNLQVTSKIKSKLTKLGIKVTGERYFEEGDPVTVLYLSRPVSLRTVRKIVQEIVRELGYRCKADGKYTHIDLEEEGIITVTVKGRKIEVVEPYIAPEEFNWIVEEEEEIGDWFVATYSPPAEIDLESGEDVEGW